MKQIKIISLLAVILWVIGMEIYRAGRPWDRSQPDFSDLDFSIMPQTEFARAEVEGFELGVAFKNGFMTQQQVMAAIGGTNLVIGYGDAFETNATISINPSVTTYAPH